MNLPLLLLFVVLPSVGLFFIYGRAYLWVYRAPHYEDAQRSPASDTGEDGTPAQDRPLTRPERISLGAPLRSAVLATLTLVTGFGAMALFRSGEVTLSILGLFCMLALAVCVVVFWLLDRLPVSVRVRKLRGALVRPPGDMDYVPPGAFYVGGAPVLYPVHWQPFVLPDLDSVVDVEVTENGAVVRHGTLLSLNDETTRFGNRPWEPTALLAAGLVALFIATLFFYAPVGSRIDTARDALSGHRVLAFSNQEEWLQWAPQVGDEITVSGATAACGLNTGSPQGKVAATGLHHCDEIAVGKPAGEPTAIVLTEPQKTAAQLSQIMEKMLLSRRNATREEVRRDWRLAGRSSSQRYTLTSVSAVVNAVDVLCTSEPCPARDALKSALAAPGALDDTPGDAQTLLLDAPVAQALSSAVFALADQRLGNVRQRVLDEAVAQRQAARWIVQSVIPMPLAQVPVAPPLPGEDAQAQAGQPGFDSPRLRLLLTQQALSEQWQHVVNFHGRVSKVDMQAQPPRIVVDPRVVPTPAWVKIAPAAALGILGILALLFSVTALVQRRKQSRAQALGAIDYEARLASTPPPSASE